MTYLVMENHPGYSVVMDERGAFYRVANLGYEVGERVSGVVFMKDPDMKDSERKEKRRGFRRVYAAALAACLLLVLVPVINLLTAEQATIYMTINPQVQIEIEEDGEVTDIKAGNKDGRQLTEQYSWEDKHVNRVFDDLVDRAREMGFLTEGDEIRADIRTENRQWAEELGDSIFGHLEEYTGGAYTIVIRINNEDYAIRQVVAPTTETTSETAAPASGGDSGYGDSDYGSIITRRLRQPRQPERLPLRLPLLRPTGETADMKGIRAMEEIQATGRFSLR